MKKLEFRGLMLLFLIGGSVPSQAQTVLSYWDFNNVSPVYSSAGSLLGSFTTTTNGPGAAPNANGELYNTATSRLSGNSSVGAAFSDPGNVYIDFSSTASSGGADGASGGHQVGYSGPLSPVWGAWQDAAGNPGSGGSNLASGDGSTQDGALLLVAGANATSDSIVFDLSSLGYQSLSISLADRATASSGIVDTFSYSLDGSHWTAIGTVTPGSGSFNRVSLSLPSVLDDQGAFYLQMSTSLQAAGSNAIDNFQLTGTAMVPEPPAAMLSIAGLLACLSAAFGTMRRKVPALA